MNAGDSALPVPPVYAMEVGKWLHPGAPGFLVMVWMGNHAGCELAGMDGQRWAEEPGK